MMIYDELEQQVLNSLKALNNRAGEDYGALAQTVYNALELSIMDKRTSIINALMPVLLKFERSARSLLSALSDGQFIFVTKNKKIYTALMDREIAKIAFLELKRHFKTDKSWAGLLDFAKRQRNRTPKTPKTLEDLFKEFLTKAERTFTREEIIEILTTYLPNNDQAEQAQDHAQDKEVIIEE